MRDMKSRTAIHTGARSALVAAFALSVACSTEPEEPVYRLVPVSTRDIIVQVSAAGTVEPVMTVAVKSKASGEIFEMRVETGDAVRAGELLLRVDPRIPEATLRQAEADSILAQAELETAESQLRRAEQLHETESITEVEYEDARLAVASARASLIRAERSLEDARISAEDTEVRAPISGVVIDKRVEEGTVITSATSGASAGTALLQMANLDTVQVRSLVDETDIGGIEPGLQVTITIDAYPNRPFRGRVLKIEPQAEVSSNVTMFPVLVRIPNEDGLLRPGMNGEVEILIGRRRGVVAVPNAALRTPRDFLSAATVFGLDPQETRRRLFESRSGGRDREQARTAEYIAFVMRDSLPTAVWIRTGLTDQNYAEVLEGITAADTVMVLPGMNSSSEGGLGMPGGRGMGRGMGPPPGGRPPRR